MEDFENEDEYGGSMEDEDGNNEESVEESVEDDAPVYIRWEKPNGTRITSNSEPATIKECLRLGWERTEVF